MAEPERRVVVVDYGLGNLFSVCRALEQAGGSPTISSDPKIVAAAERILLPGVGAFGDGMRGLNERGLTAALHDFAKTGRPLLSVCLGMQLLMSVGEEFGEHPGLGLIPGRVVKLTPTAPDGRALKLPHIGWNRINPGPSGWAGTTLSDLKAGTAVYFVHSYAPQPQDPAHVMATCEYGTTRFCSAVRRENLSGCQFHPEKSGPTGLLILSRFLRH